MINSHGILLAGLCLTVLMLCPGCWSGIEHIQAEMWLDVVGQVLDEAGQPVQDAPVVASIGAPATDDQLARLLADSESAENGQGITRTQDGLFQVQAQDGTYPAIQFEYGHIEPDPGPVPDPVQTIYLYVLSGQQWLSLEIPVQPDWQQDAYDGVRIAVLPDVRLSTGGLTLSDTYGSPLLRDVSGFSTFQVTLTPGMLPFPEPGEIDEVNIVRNAEGRYHLRMSVQQALGAPAWLPERDLTDEEVTQMLAIFSRIHLRPPEPGIVVDAAWFYGFSWDATTISAYPGVYPSLHSLSFSEILSLLEDLRNGS